MTNIILPEIETERLFLKKLDSSDWQMISYLRSDETVNKYVKRATAKTQAEALQFIDKINSGIANNETLYWKITRKHDPKMIGSICLWNFSADSNTAEIGYDLSPEWQGKGLMSEALKAVIRYGFQSLHLDAMTAYTHRHNLRSSRLLERHGFSLLPEKKDEHNPDNIIYILQKTVEKSPPE